MDALTILQGAAAGAAATAVMTAIELGVRLRWGLPALLDWQQNQATAARITKGRAEATPFTSLAVHFLHGLVAGLVFVIVLPVLPSAFRVVAYGLGYGLILFALTLLAHKPTTGTPVRSGSRAMAAAGVAFMTHIVYGLVLAGFLLWP